MNDDLQRLWPDGKLLDVGRAIYEALPVLSRPAWAGAILDLCRSRWTPVSAVDAVCDIADDSRRWHEAHDAFSAVRLLNLACERSRSCHPTYEALLHVAELVAKVTFNATDTNAPFDEDSGWWLPQVVRHFARTLNDSEFDATAIRFLASESLPNERSA